MTPRTRLAAAVAAILVSVIAAQSQTAEKRPITFQDLISLHRLSEPQLSPDAKWIAYTISTPDLEANHSVRDIWLVPTAAGEPRQLTHGGSDTRPRWSPDGQKLAFISARVEGNQQVFSMDVKSGTVNRITFLSAGADNELWSPDGKTIAFVSSVYPDCTNEACNARRDAEKSKSKVKAHIHDRLLYRHWNSWSDGKRSHLFIISAEGGTPGDLTQ